MIRLGSGFVKSSLFAGAALVLAGTVGVQAQSCPLTAAKGEKKAACEASAAVEAKNPDGGCCAAEGAECKAAKCDKAKAACTKADGEKAACDKAKAACTKADGEKNCDKAKAACTKADGEVKAACSKEKKDCAAGKPDAEVNAVPEVKAKAETPVVVQKD